MDDTVWKREVEEGIEALDCERYSAAEGHLRTALALMQAQFRYDDPALIDILEPLAKSCCAQQKFAPGRAFYRRLIALREKALGPDHPDVVSTKTNLAMIREAEDLLLQSPPNSHKTSGASQ